MTNIKKIIKAIEQAKASRGAFSNSEKLSILKATKGIKKDESLINSIINDDLILKTNTLTSREREIFSFIGNSKSTKVIAQDLGLSVSTIETHRKNIRKKLGLKGKDKLFEFALLTNIITNQ